MNLEDVKAAAELYFELYGLDRDSWTFSFDRSKSRFGYCLTRKRLITMSRVLCELNSETEVIDCLLHEIAHALTPFDRGHGQAWKDMCVKVGAQPKRCYSLASVKTPKGEWEGTCPLGHRVHRHRRPIAGRRYSCSVCSPNVWNEKFLLTWTRELDSTDKRLKGTRYYRKAA